MERVAVADIAWAEAAPVARTILGANSGVGVIAALSGNAATASNPKTDNKYKNKVILGVGDSFQVGNSLCWYRN